MTSNKEQLRIVDHRFESYLSRGTYVRKFRGPCRRSLFAWKLKIPQTRLDGVIVADRKETVKILVVLTSAPQLTRNVYERSSNGVWVNGSQLIIEEDMWLNIVRCLWDLGW
ncbi:hypothetical protein V9T40_011096 [Parthenolecanium corni]|uniref:Uncharacterized protein n=1 Tax=Parthenolecanium corni TaxID=536013 RepID=A0AAN9T7A4_9HEMI